MHYKQHLNNFSFIYVFDLDGYYWWLQRKLLTILEHVALLQNFEHFRISCFCRGLGTLAVLLLVQCAIQKQDFFDRKYSLNSAGWGVKSIFFNFIVYFIVLHEKNFLLCLFAWNVEKSKKKKLGFNFTWWWKKQFLTIETVKKNESEISINTECLSFLVYLY